MTQDELLIAPASMLSREQKVERRKLKKEKKRREGKTHAERGLPYRNSKGAVIKWCQGVKANKDACARPAVHGSMYCKSHMSEEEKERLGLNVKRPQATPKRTAPELLRATVEQAVDKLVRRYFLALGLELVGFDEEGNPVVEDLGPDQGLVLHGESREGVIKLSAHPDLVQQIAVMEKLLDRVYGRPKQTQVLEGGKKPVAVQPVRSADRAQEVADLLNRVGAVPRHGGRQRREPTQPTEGEAHASGDATTEPDRAEP